ncbi:TIM barrel protein [Candidatus Woesearchaeota archaeon]|nr:TIM barrel protein [Candidatus Woesearchaeota archaeon]
MDKIRFGTAGIPLNMPNRNTIDAPNYIRELGLDAMELEFVHSINLTNEKAKELKKAAEDNDLKLSCHAPYFVNLCSNEPSKIAASKQRILKSAEIANIAGAESVTFHAGYYQGKDTEKVYEKIKKEIQEIVLSLRKKGNTIKISPETTGKGSQFGSIKELVKIAQEIKGVSLCVDFAHLYARSIGKFNGEKDFGSTIDYIKNELGKSYIEDMHVHFSGMNYGPKGERNHLVLEDENNKFDYKGLIKAFQKYKVKGIIVSESPNIEKDALLMQKLFMQ